MNTIEYMATLSMLADIQASVFIHITDAKSNDKINDLQQYVSTKYREHHRDRDRK